MTVDTANEYIVCVIQDYYESLRAKNGLFSQRALAAKLNVSPSTLSEILKRKRRLNKTTASGILNIIAPEDPKALHCLDFLEDHYTPYKVEKIPTLHIQKEQALLFERWYHLAILIFFDSKIYDGTAQSIANYFGVTLEQVEEATQRLLKVGAITQENGRFKVKAQFFITEPSKISDSIHKSKKIALENALIALDNKSQEPSSNFSMMFTVFDKKLVPEAIKYLDKMKEGFVKKFNGKGDQSAVYQMSIQFFPCENLGGRERNPPPSN